MQRASIEVIIPSYRHFRYLLERVRSIEVQTRPPRACFVVDDASGDGSAEFFEQWKPAFEKNVEINLRNSGNPFAQWNRALAKTSADFIWIAESDDSSTPTFLEQAAAMLEANPKVGMVVAQSSLINERGEILEKTPLYLERIDPGHWRKNYINSGVAEIREYLCLRNTIPNASGCLFRREALIGADLGNIPYRLCGDWLAYVRILKTWDIGFIARPLNRFRVHAATVRATGDRDGFCMLETYRVQGEISRLVELLPAQKEKAALCSFSGWEQAIANGTARSRRLLLRPELLDAARAFDDQFEHRRGWNKGPEVSIVMPFLNAGPEFIETAEAVLAQTNISWEWLIVDNGSMRAESVKMLAEVVMRDARIRSFRLDESCPTGVARNKALRHVRGEFILFLDAGDRIDPTFIEKMLWRLLTAPAWAYAKSYREVLSSAPSIWEKGLQAGAHFLSAPILAMVRVSAVRDVGGFDEELTQLEDWDFWLRLAKKGHRGGVIPEVLDSTRRQHVHGRSASLEKPAQSEVSADEMIRSRFGDLSASHFEVPSVAIEGLSTWARLSARWSVQMASSQRLRLFMFLPHLEMGGADRLNLDLLQYWVQQRGFAVTIIATQPLRESWLDAFSAHTKDIFYPKNIIPIEAMPAFIKHLLVTRDPCAIYLSHSEETYQLLPLIRAMAPEIPIVDLVHIVTKDWMNGGFPRITLSSWRYLDATIATSHQVKNWMVAQGADPNQIEVVYTGIDPEKWGRPKAKALRLKGPHEPVRLLFAARFVEQKNPKLLVPLVKHLKQAGVAFTLFVAGDGPDRAWMERHLFLPHEDVVVRLGLLGPEAVREQMLDADLLLLPSQEEGIALVLFEAMSLGLPFIATDVGGQSELVTAECGVLLPVDKNLSRAFNREVERLVRNAPIRISMGEAGRKRVEKDFNFAKTANQTTSILLQRRIGRGMEVTTERLDEASILAKSRTLDRAQFDAYEWNEIALSGWNLVRICSLLGSVLRQMPLVGRWYTRFEGRYGEQIGRYMLKLSRRKVFR